MDGLKDKVGLGMLSDQNRDVWSRRRIRGSLPGGVARGLESHHRVDGSRKKEESEQTLRELGFNTATTIEKASAVWKDAAASPPSAWNPSEAAEMCLRGGECQLRGNRSLS